MPQKPNQKATPTSNPIKRRKGGWVRLKIATRLSAIDRAELIEATVDPLEHLLETATDEEIDALLVEQLEQIIRRPPLTVDQFVDRVIARKAAARTHHARPSNARAKCIPKRLRPACGAKTRAGGRCRATPVWDKENNRPRNGRCRMHGGLSTDPKTPEGKARSISYNST